MKNMNTEIKIGEDEYRHDDVYDCPHLSRMFIYDRRVEIDIAEISLR